VGKKSRLKRLTVDQLAAAAGVTTRTIKRRVAAGVIRSVGTRGRAHVYAPSDVAKVAPVPRTHVPDELRLDEIHSRACSAHTQRIELQRTFVEDAEWVPAWRSFVDAVDRQHVSTWPDVVASVIGSLPPELALHLDSGQPPRPKRVPVRHMTPDEVRAIVAGPMSSWTGLAHGDDAECSRTSKLKLADAAEKAGAPLALFADGELAIDLGDDHYSTGIDSWGELPAQPGEVPLIRPLLDKLSAWVESSPALHLVVATVIGPDDEPDPPRLESIEAAKSQCVRELVAFRRARNVARRKATRRRAAVLQRTFAELAMFKTFWSGFAADAGDRAGDAARARDACEAMRRSTVRRLRTLDDFVSEEEIRSNTRAKARTGEMR
jgi:hypothetical protein